MSGGRQRFSIIPAMAVTDTRLEPRDLQVLCLLGRHTDDLGWCCRSQVKMAKELVCGRATIQRALGRLVEAGYLEHRPKQRASGADAAHDYRVVLDQPETATSSESSGQGVPTSGQGVPTSGQGVPTHERAPMLTTPDKREREMRAREPEGASQPGAEPGGEAGGAEPGERAGPENADKAFRRRFRDFCKRYPGAVFDQLEKAETIWLAMTEDARCRAEQRLDPFVETLKGPKGGMRRRPPLQEYLGEAKFDLVEAPEAGETARLEALKASHVQRFTRPWWWLWWETLRQAQQDSRGWPVLAQQTSKAETTALPWVIDPARRSEIDTAAARLVQVGRDSAQARAWADWCRTIGPDRFGVRFPKPDTAPFIWVPEEWPPDARQQSFDDQEVVL